MKIFTNKNNTSTLKLLIAAQLSGKRIELVDAKFEDNIFSGPRSLPLLVVNDDLTFFSSNAAIQYLLGSNAGESIHHLEWEATRLNPIVTTVLAGKAPSDVRQALSSLLQTIDRLIEKNKYFGGATISPVDVSIWSSIYPLLSGDLRTQYMQEFKHLARWFDEFGLNKSVQEALKQWEGSSKGPLGATSAFGAPQLPTMSTPLGSPDEEVEAGPTPEQILAAKEAWAAGVGAPTRHKQEKIVLPQKGRKNILITSALPYVNNVPHLGNIIGCVLSADIFARYCRSCGYNTLYVCGTDEYGTATETKALEEGVTPKQICDKYYEIHNSVYRWFNIGFDYFGRTSTPQQTEICQSLFLKLMENGFVEPQSVDQLFCEKCERFLADRFVEGICPHPGCLYDSARGDQCDKCGKLINAIELIEPKCKVCKHKPIVKPSTQLFIDLAQLEPVLRTWLGARSAAWSAPARAVTRSWLREPLRARAVTRDLKWGVPVPVTGFTNKVFYVWFDAPIGYMSITQAATNDYEKWWKPDKEYDVQLYQFMAKDNVPFHAIMFPATLLGVNEGHLCVHNIFATEYLNYEEGKFSKSRGVGVFGTDAVDTNIPSDVWRFYLAAVRPESQDSSFSWTDLGTRNNSELLNNLGNFCHRSLSFCANTFGGKLPRTVLRETDYILVASVNTDIVAYIQHMQRGRLREALRHVLQVSKRGNQYMQATQPWVLLKGSDDDKECGATAVGLCCQLVALLCTLLAPYMPDTSRTLATQLNVNVDDLYIDAEKPFFRPLLSPGHVINKPEPLFTKIEPATLDTLRAKYAGTQTDRANRQNGEASTENVGDLEAEVAKQGEKVRQLKSSTKDKSVWQPEVEKLLALKQKLTQAQAQGKQTTLGGKQTAQGGKQTAQAGKQTAQAGKQTGQAQPNDNIPELEKAIVSQGDKVRKLKASTKDKSVWQPEVNVLLDLKKRLAALQTK